MRKVEFACSIIAGLALHAVVAQGQSVRSLVHAGNDQYEEKNFDGAEVNYRKALEQERELVQGHFNLGNALHKQGKYEDAVREFEQVAMDARQPETKAFAYYNIGNSRFEGQQYQEAIASYIESLKLNPADLDAKHNLSLALKRLEQQQQQPQQQQQEGQDENKDKDQQEKDQQQQQQDQNKDRDREGEKEKDQQKDQERKPAKQQPKRMSKADAERILDVLKNSEKEIQKKLKARKAARAKGEKDW
ncbi:MAG: tetratricopeptide repeat protein [Bacteroidota bacterium]